MATLLPNAVQQFFDANGNPLADGTVTFYVPNTTVPKDTWQDSGATILNTNPVQLDAAGEAVIYGTGIYRQIVKDINGNLIWDGLTADTAAGGLAWGGISGGTPNAQTIAPSSFSSQDGQQISFIAGLTNTSQLTVNGIAVLNDTVNGPAPLTGGEVVEDNAVTLIYDAPRGAFHIVNPTAITDDKIANSFKAKIVGSVATRTALAALAGGSYLSVNLREAGRQGIFNWNAGNLSASVSADAMQGLYVPPTSDPSGATGCWVRQYSGLANVKWFGAAGDGIADDTAELQAATDLVKGVFVPDGTYKITDTWQLTDYSNVTGESNQTIISGALNRPLIALKDRLTDRHYFMHISNLRVDGLTSVGGSVAIDMSNGTYCRVRDVLMQNCSYAMKFGGATSAYYNVIEAFTISDCGVAISQSTLANANVFKNGTIKTCVVGTEDDDNSDTTYDDVKVEVFTNSAHRVANTGLATVMVRILDGRQENPSKTGSYASAAAIRVNAASVSARLYNNYITVVATGIINSGTDTIDTGNTIP